MVGGLQYSMYRMFGPLCRMRQWGSSSGAAARQKQGSRAEGDDNSVSSATVSEDLQQQGRDNEAAAGGWSVDGLARIAHRLALTACGLPGSASAAMNRSKKP